MVIPTPDPTPTATTTLTATPGPTATLETVLAPDPTPTATAAPKPTLTPTATLVSTLAPEPTLTVTAAPTATLVPAPDPTPTPFASTGDGLGLWRGLAVAPEHRCSPYDSDDYSYPQSVESRIVASMGGIIYGPYTGTYLASMSETDIEHIVARSEAHDSGLCATDPATKRRFAADLLNLTLASPTVNRSHKRDRDASEWLPDLNACWFANCVVEMRQQYAITVDQRERDVLENILSGCSSTAMVVTRGARPTPTPVPSTRGSGGVDALRLYDSNGNGRITCAEAREHGIAPVRRGHPAYRYMDDRDGDGIVCE